MSTELKLISANEMERRTGIHAAERRALERIGYLKSVRAGPRFVAFDEENVRKAEEYVAMRKAKRLA